jgi:hypothetical protein
MKKDGKIGENPEAEEDLEKSPCEIKFQRAILACAILAVGMAGICVWQLTRFYGKERIGG